MIPKIIHYCWFGSKPLSETAEQCIASWKKHLSDYEIVLWNEENSPMNCPFVKSAYEAGKYAFVSDYVRLFAVYEHGGIYLDTDMLVLKRIDDFLHDGCFVGWQDDTYLNASIIGAEKGYTFLHELIQRYKKLQFSSQDISLFTIPLVLTQAFQELSPKVKVYPSEYFYPYPFEARTKGDTNIWKYLQDNSYTVHLWDGTWIEGFENELGNVQSSKVKFWKKLIWSRVTSLFRVG